ncbi:MAG: hypothetical protein G3M78_09030 [Candidatus Nitrohelix vancouverensis]|uniref:Uncharacterized protein n=1 Tax=Candidatus Nitrohelix vancouverensis TaxID=2705534 RepID=A0A7T0C2X7_9BACT|nr:MAG: hypothetical protein G3M78_09030 [Candidatus Nitrohelix vancouverensis]
MKQALSYLVIFLLSFLIFDALTVVLSVAFAVCALFYLSNRWMEKSQL